MNRPIDEQKTMEAQRRERGDGSTPVGQDASASNSGTQKAREAAREAANAGKERLRAGSDRAAESVDHVAEAVGTAASRLNELEHDGLADHASRLASYLSDMSDKLRERNVDEVTEDVRRLAQRNPALFLLGSVAIGIGLSRFAKASTEKRSLDRADEDAEWRGAATTSRSPAHRVGEDRAAADRPLPPDTTGGGL